MVLMDLQRPLINTFSKNKSILEGISKQGISEMLLILKSSESREL